MQPHVCGRAKSVLPGAEAHGGDGQLGRIVSDEVPVELPVVYWSITNRITSSPPRASRGHAGRLEAYAARASTQGSGSART
jgi:hypothetical protein